VTPPETAHIDDWIGFKLGANPGRALSRGAGQDLLARIWTSFAVKECLATLVRRTESALRPSSGAVRLKICALSRWMWHSTNACAGERSAQSPAERRAKEEEILAAYQ
jgi:hypothetical protein